MDNDRIEEPQSAFHSVYRVRMVSSYEELGRYGVFEVTLAEALIARTIKRQKGQTVPSLPKTLRDLKDELEMAEHT